MPSSPGSVLPWQRLICWYQCGVSPYLIFHAWTFPTVFLASEFQLLQRMKPFTVKNIEFIVLNPNSCLWEWALSARPGALFEVKRVQCCGEGSVQVRGVETQAVHWATHSRGQLEHLWQGQPQS